MKKRRLLTIFASALALFGVSTSTSAENYKVLPTTVTTISGDNADAALYDPAATEWKINYGKVSGNAFAIAEAGSSSVALAKFDVSAYKDMGITKAVLEFHSYCTVENKNSQIHVAYADLNTDLTTATWTTVNAAGASISDIWTSTEWVKPAGADLAATVTDAFTNDEDKIITFGFFTGTAREQAISSIKLTLYTDAQTPIGYTVNAVDESGNLLKVLGEGSDFEGTDIKVAYPKYLLGADNTIYTKGATNKVFSYPFTLNADGQVENLKYTAGATDVLYLIEGEDIADAKIISDGNAAIRASNTKTGFNDEKDLALTTLPNGKYKIVAGIFDAGKTASAELSFACGTDTVFTAKATGTNLGEKTSDEFTLSGASNNIVLKAGGSTSSQKSLDYVYIQKTGDAEIVATPATGIINISKLDIPVSSSTSTDGDILKDTTLVADDFSMTISPKESGSNNNRFWSTTSAGPELRVYNGTITVKAAAGKTLNKIVFAQTKWGTMEADNGTLTEQTWTGEAETVKFTVSAQCRITAVTVGDYTAPVVEVANIAAFKALESGTEAKLALNGTKVTFVSDKNAYIEDETGGLLVYNSGLDLTAGKALTGYINGVFTLYNGSLPELTTSAQTASSVFTAEDAVIIPTEMTLAEWSEGKGICQLINLRDVKVNADWQEMTQGEAAAGIYDKFNVLPEGYTYPSLIECITVIAEPFSVYPVSADSIKAGKVIIHDVKNIAELKALETDSEAKLTLNDAKITVNIDNMRNIDILLEDATGAITIGQDIAFTLEEAFAEDSVALNGVLYGTFVKGFGEIKLDVSDSTIISNITVTPTTITPTVMTLAEAMTEANAFRLVTFKNIGMVEHESYGAALTDGTTTLPLFIKYGNMPYDENWAPIIFDELEYITGFLFPDGESFMFTPVGDPAYKEVAGPSYKEFAETFVFLPTAENVTAGIEEGWIVGGATRADGKKGNIDPATGESVDATKYDGVGVKYGNDSKKFVVYVTGITKVIGYGVSTSSSASRDFIITATPTEGEAVTASGATAPNETAVVELTLDKTKLYMIDFTGKEGEKAGDVAVHGVKFVCGVSDGITNVNAASTTDSNVYTINGTMVRKAGESLKSLNKGLYIIGGKKVVVK